MSTSIEYSEYTKQFKCPMCDELCDSKAEAKSHCIDEIEIDYSCDECGEEFDTKTLAKKCCPYYICDECGEGFETKHETMSCRCNDMETE